LAQVPNYLGTPFTLGTYTTCDSDDCSYGYAADNLPAGVGGLTMIYSENHYGSLASGMRDFATRSNTVINNLDVEPQLGMIALSRVQTGQAGGFDFRLETVPPAQLAETVAAGGATSRVVTAVGLDASTQMAEVISYGWQGDTTTVYETTAQILSAQNINSAALAIAKSRPRQRLRRKR
jgi:hypothetical protein